MDLNTYLSTVESAKSLAAKMGIHPVLLSQWRNKVRPVPIEQCVPLERATNGLVTRHSLRPDDWHEIWPELVQQPKTACNQS
ncbi:transcriptional regulator [Nitrosomonas communis]|uniref:transcriptional regulator n=1 Tax=Nitrosomonas communis TaxID=44574 RepID=UPI0034E9543D|nr:helix-turn-helix domain-containing protein [Nitrosomonas communis]